MAPKRGGGPAGGPGAEGPKQTISKPSAPARPVTIAAPATPAAPKTPPSGGGQTRTVVNRTPAGATQTGGGFVPGSGGRPGTNVVPGKTTTVRTTVGIENPRPTGGGGKPAGDRTPTGGPNIGWDNNLPPGDEGGFGSEDGGMGYDPFAAYSAAQDIEYQQRINNVIAVVTALFKEYGLESLTSKVIDYARQGYDADAIGVMLRDTPEYKARFPAMATLMSKKRAISEAEYISYEKQAAALEKRYGLPGGLVQGAVTTLLENDVSASELQDRVVMASDAALQAPQELRDTFRNYYGIDSGALAGYFLDPALATPLLQKQYVSSQIGSEAMRQNVGIRVDVAENLQQLGITQDVAREGFSDVSRQMAFTGGRGDLVSQEQLIGGNLLQRQQDIQEIERVAQTRLGRFQSGGSYVQESGGVSGLRGSST